MIKTVIRSQNNMVLVFDRNGEQLTEYQGQHEGVKKSILRDAPMDAVFAHVLTNGREVQTVPREEW